MAGNALRLLACAMKTELGELSSYDGTELHHAHKLLAEPANYAKIESDMIFLGVAGLQDPPRPEVSCRMLIDVGSDLCPEVFLAL